MKNSAALKGLILIIFILSIILIFQYTDLKKYFTAEILKAWILELGPWGPVAYIVIYSISPVMLLPALPLTVAGGILFGPVGGIIYTAIGSTIGASIAFLISRYLARELVAKLLSKKGLWSELDKEVEKRGWKIVAFTRLIPLFPFNFLNYAFGLTKIKFSHYVLASSVFMLPAIVAFVLFSSSLLDLFSGKVSKEFLTGLFLVIIVSALPILYKRMKKKSALIIVDVQNDFCPGGSLPVPEGNMVVPALNNYIQMFQKSGLPIYASRDWHPEKTRHFKAYGGLWPPHCVQGTKGAEFHPDLKPAPSVIIITKGTDPEEDSYSCFQAYDSEGKPFAKSLKEKGIKHLYVGGLATDYCVRATVLDALKAGFSVTVLIDAIKGVDIKHGDSARALEEMEKAGADKTSIEDLRL